MLYGEMREDIDQVSPVRRGAVILTLGLFAAISGVAASDAAHEAPQTVVETSFNPEGIGLTFDDPYASHTNAVVPRPQLIIENPVLITNGPRSCSGSTINDNGVAVGFSTAGHCLPSSVSSRTAESPQVRLSTVDGDQQEVNSVIRPTSANQDVALIPLGNTAPEVVVNAYENRLTTGSSLGQRAVGYAYPEEATSLQTYDLTILGTGTARGIDVTWAVMPETADGATCSLGASGSEAYISGAIGTGSIGNLVAQYDLRGKTHGTPESAQIMREYLSEKYPRIDFSREAASAICGYSTSITDYEVLDITPGETEDLELARTMFSSERDHHIIDGVIRVAEPETNNPNIITLTHLHGAWITPTSDPNEVIIGAYSETTQEVSMRRVTLESITVYPYQPSGSPTIKTVSGIIHLSDSAETPRRYTAPDGTDFGINLNYEAPEVGNTPYQISVENNIPYITTK